MPTNYNPDTDALETMQERFDGQPYDIEAIIFYDWYTDEETGEQRKSYFTCYESAQPITFPYTPERVYRKRIK